LAMQHKSPQRTLMQALVAPRSDPILRCENRNKVYVPDIKLQRIAPATILRNALPTELANDLLQSLMDDCQSWTSCTWTVFGKQHTVPRSSAEYRLPKKGGQEYPEPDSSSRSGDASVFLGTKTRTRAVHAAHVVAKAGAHLQRIIQNLRPRQTPLWCPTIALGNCYKDGESSVGFHSDFLSHLGPRPIIVGLSLGATRDFSLRKANDTATIAIPMPHNTVVVMWGDCQESWQHAVPRTKSVKGHSVSGKMRLSLTFRMGRPDIAQFNKNCFCGKPAMLKSSTKSGEPSYYLACSPIDTAKQVRALEVPPPPPRPPCTAVLRVLRVSPPRPTCTACPPSSSYMYCVCPLLTACPLCHAELPWLHTSPHHILSAASGPGVSGPNEKHIVSKDSKTMG
jgi:alkylated DNA repair dioxygenase AlkB